LFVAAHRHISRSKLAYNLVTLRKPVCIVLSLLFMAAADAALPKRT